jgi:hypothetical protein
MRFALHEWANNVYNNVNMPVLCLFHEVKCRFSLCFILHAGCYEHGNVLSGSTKGGRDVSTS